MFVFLPHLLSCMPHLAHIEIRPFPYLPYFPEKISCGDFSKTTLLPELRAFKRHVRTLHAFFDDPGHPFHGLLCRSFGSQAALLALKPLFEKRQQLLQAMSVSDGVVGPGLALLSSRRRKLQSLRRKV